VRPGCDRRTARTPRGRRGAPGRDGCCEKRVELLEPLVQRKQLVAPLDQEVLSKLVAPEHLENQPAEVAEPVLADTQ